MVRWRGQNSSIRSHLSTRGIQRGKVTRNWIRQTQLSHFMWHVPFTLLSINEYCDSIYFFWSAFAKFRKATISFVMSVRPSAWNISASAGRLFMKLDISVPFENMSKNFKFHRKLRRMTGTLH